MTDYTKLVEALRYCEFGWSAQTCDNCEYSKTDCQLLLGDAADAIEALQAEIRESMQRCAECGDELAQQMPKRGEIVRCGECKYSSKPDTNGEIWCKREDHGEDLMECHGVGWFCADGEREVQE